ncbi:hypothetical protein TELCIR_14746, partial [Teladorsagia circumcincta]
FLNVQSPKKKSKSTTTPASHVDSNSAPRKKLLHLHLQSGRCARWAVSRLALASVKPVDIAFNALHPTSATAKDDAVNQCFRGAHPRRSPAETLPPFRSKFLAFLLTYCMTK